MLRKILALASLLFIGILGYGYWHASTHGWLYISILDISDPGQKYKLVKGAKIVLLDSKKDVLAEGRSDNRHGVVYLAHPEVGFCVEEESKAPFSKATREKWYACYEKQSTWVVKWSANVKFINVEFDNCLLQDIPVSVKEFGDDWWLWWVPHPHIGGKPSTYFSIDIMVDANKCSVTAQ